MWWLGVLLGATIDIECRNPLFATHWFGKNDIQVLNNFPTVKTNLVRCPAYNQRSSCCHATFETEQMKYFNFWRQILHAKIARIENHRKSIEEVAQSQEYASASELDREQYNAVLQHFAPVLSPEMYADCFSAILTYVAGMICFGCHGDWMDFVELYRQKVVRVRISTTVCVELFQRCEKFGEASMRLKQSVLDALLGKQAEAPMENLDMFNDQQQLCDWAHNRIALHPFSNPTEEDKEDSLPISGSTVVRSLEVVEHLDVLEEGRLSGFPRRWVAATGGRVSVSVSILIIGLATLYHL